MKNLGIIFTASTLLLILFSCIDSKDKKLIIGKWTGTEWLVSDGPSGYDPQKATFTFDDNGKYSFDYAGSVEQGDYFISNNQLYTTPEGGIKMMVRVVKLTTDTLIFDMNRGGQGERLTLIRK